MNCHIFLFHSKCSLAVFFLFVFWFVSIGCGDGRKEGTEEGMGGQFGFWVEGSSSGID